MVYHFNEIVVECGYKMLSGDVSSKKLEKVEVESGKFAEICFSTNSCRKALMISEKKLCFEGVTAY
jgi:hypothetical protein